jgi:hypothetical protein
MRRVLKIKTINYAREPILNVYYGYRFRRVSSNGQNPVRPRPKLTPFGPIFQGLRRLSKRWLTWWRPAQQTTHNSARQCRNEIKRKEEESSLSKTCTAPAHNSKIVLIFFFCVSFNISVVSSSSASCRNDTTLLAANPVSPHDS